MNVWKLAFIGLVGLFLVALIWLTWFYWTDPEPDPEFRDDRH